MVEGNLPFRQWESRDEFFLHLPDRGKLFNDMFIQLTFMVKARQRILNEHIINENDIRVTMQSMTNISYNILLLEIVYQKAILKAHPVDEKIFKDFYDKVRTFQFEYNTSLISLSRQIQALDFEIYLRGYRVGPNVDNFNNAVVDYYRTSFNSGIEKLVAWEGDRLVKHRKLISEGHSGFSVRELDDNGNFLDYRFLYKNSKKRLLA